MIPCGKITITNTDGEHRTFRIKKQKPDDKFAPDKTVISLLTGSDNQADYTGFGFVDGAIVKVWQSKQTKIFLWYAKIIELLFNGKPAAEADMDLLARYKVQHSKLCMYCMRELTDPLSIERGIGPECYRLYVEGKN